MAGTLRHRLAAGASTPGFNRRVQVARRKAKRTTVAANYRTPTGRTMPY